MAAFEASLYAQSKRLNLQVRPLLTVLDAQRGSCLELIGEHTHSKM